MKDIEFWRVSLNDWVYEVNGTIRRSSNGFELRTESETVKAFLRRCMENEEVINNPIVNVGQSFHFYAGDFQVINMDGERIILSKLNK
ncbi:hypothetical protein AV656_15250 [Bhargavaea cecembensis]|uniref:Uncharacterized protein n=1 Tax=Bhargavaea cecembensis TaxID=394098 RepID=A0A165GI80_9BACL|nr:hypothetical protein [Bhargavaea cecembensis]KZE36489.1 hypothetical protein AV656_15250 [Bhargavaea cecembensis]